MAKLLLLLMTTYALANSGYPVKGIEITFEKEALIRNSFCFPVVLTVNGMTHELAANTTKNLATTHWSRWNWMPGSLGSLEKKSVLHPLRPPVKISFGEDTGISHRGPDKYSYDFNVPVKTPVYAMEAGLVTRVIDHFQEAHLDQNRKHEGNIIEIIHQDGTVGRYSHLHPGSALIKACDRVKAGDQVGLSGNTGFSAAPHLHVDIYRPLSGESYTTLPLSFR